MKFILYITETTLSLDTHLVMSVNQAYILHQFIRILLYMDSSIPNGTQRSRPMMCFIFFWTPDLSCQWQRFPTNVSQNIVTFPSGGKKKIME